MSHALLGHLSLELDLADTGTGVLKEGAQKQAGHHQTCGHAEGQQKQMFSRD